MLIESGNIQSRLHWMIRGLLPPLPKRHGTDDLMQEALLHLWRQETDYPGQSPQWYVESCRFYLQNFLRQGRSVDSLKHYRDRIFLREKPFDGTHPDEPEDPNAVQWDEVGVNDIIAELTQWLTPQEKDTLRCLMDGWTARETARRLNVSHTLVNRHRSRIASLTLKLGVAPSRKEKGPNPKQRTSS